MKITIALRNVRPIRAAWGLAAGLLLSTGAFAQLESWPSRPIKMVTPTEAGSITDYLPRAFGQILQAKTQQAVVVDNRPGGNGVIAVDAVRHAPADGYTFLVNGVSTHSANPAVFSKLTYDPAKDFIDVGMFLTFPYIALVKKDSPYLSLRQLIADAKANPGKLNCGVSTVGSRVPCQLLMKRAGIDVQAVTYKSTSAVMTAVAGGVVDFAIADAGSAIMTTQGGLLRAIGVTSESRVPIYPDLPTFAETLPGFVYEGWAGLCAVAGTPRPIVEKMNLYLRQALAEPEFKKGIEARGGTIVLMTAAEQADWVSADRKRWKEWVKQADIQIQ